MIGIILFACLAAWLARYTLIGVSPGGEGVHGIAYRLDRWTGEVVWMSGSAAGVVGIKK